MYCNSPEQEEQNNAAVPPPHRIHPILHQATSISGNSYRGRLLSIPNHHNNSISNPINIFQLDIDHLTVIPPAPEYDLSFYYSDNVEYLGTQIREKYSHLDKNAFKYAGLSKNESEVLEIESTYITINLFILAIIITIFSIFWIKGTLLPMYDDALIMVLLCLTIAAFYSTYALYINFVISFSN